MNKEEEVTKVFTPKTNICVKNLEYFKEKEAEWIIPGWIPKNQITIIVGDGGVGKTSLWCHIVACLSSGNLSIFENEQSRAGVGTSKPLKIMFFSSEDSVEITLLRRLRKNNFTRGNIVTIDLEDERFQNIKFNSGFLAALVEAHKPDVLLFDPLQSFIPENVNMGQRNTMWGILNPLIALGHKNETTIIIIMHTNKQVGLYGRRRMADSSDIWDISRSVLMLGQTKEKGILYITQEKSNYGPLESTILFKLENEVPTFISFSDKKDRDFVIEFDDTRRTAPAMEEAKECILEYLTEHGQVEVKELDEYLSSIGISKKAARKAKQDLKEKGYTHTCNFGYGETKKHYIELKI